MTDQQKCEEQLAKAFELMWGKFPEPVMLIHRSRTVIAVNECCKQYGGVPGTKCNAVNPEKHKGCKANVALDKNEAIRQDSLSGETKIIGYWIPLTCVPDYYVHFGIGMVDSIKAQQTTSPQETGDASSKC
ncbi:hypothetical protein H1S01_07520 [Heliobacterium chlorum]|uniref:Uncharacterized protein n=1 Tax=Heliobacterium chlorum TaxID=2698 RepID=A0ABR7T3D1_HELCL|nr:hypothetical protein [Heliobacterium chlorum]MBC9784359.1 hypothetical protein [Heliobacterium chlorum]